MHVSGVSKCHRTWKTTHQTLKYGAVITVCDANHVKLIDKSKIQRLLNRIFFGVYVYGSFKTNKSLSLNL